MHIWVVERGGGGGWPVIRESYHDTRSEARASCERRIRCDVPAYGLGMRRYRVRKYVRQD